MEVFNVQTMFVWQLQDVFCYRRWTGDCKFHLYTSHPPCGDASIFFLNSRNKRHQIFICLHSNFTECVRKYLKLVFFTIFFCYLINFLSATALSHSEWQLHKFINFFLIIFFKIKILCVVWECLVYYAVPDQTWLRISERICQCQASKSSDATNFLNIFFYTLIPIVCKISTQAHDILLLLTGIFYSCQYIHIHNVDWGKIIDIIWILRIFRNTFQDSSLL